MPFEFFFICLIHSLFVVCDYLIQFFCTIPHKWKVFKRTNEDRAAMLAALSRIEMIEEREQREKEREKKKSYVYRACDVTWKLHYRSHILYMELLRHNQRKAKKNINIEWIFFYWINERHIPKRTRSIHWKCKFLFSSNESSILIRVCTAVIFTVVFCVFSPFFTFNIVDQANIYRIKRIYCCHCAPFFCPRVCLTTCDSTRILE